MEDRELNVILFGATGMVGSGVLLECLKHPAVKSITSISRRSAGRVDGKFKEIIHTDFLDYSSIKDSLKGHNVCFYCLGISQTQVKTKEEYHTITYEYTMAAARAISEVNDAMTFCFLSGAGTDSSMKSRFSWARVKGKAENDLSKFNFKSLYHFRPAFIYPKGGIKYSLFLAKLISPLFPLFNRFFPTLVTTTEEFGLAMINAALYGSEKQILENIDIRRMSGIYE